MGWWDLSVTRKGKFHNLKVWKEGKLDRYDLEHIIKDMENGCTSGEIVDTFEKVKEC